MNAYQTLGVVESASQDEIKKAYRKLSKEFHPDKNPGNKASEEKFKEIASAYDQIGDESKRKSYDQSRKNPYGNRSGSSNPYSGGFDFEFDLNDIFGFGNRNRQQSQSQQSREEQEVNEQFKNMFNDRYKKKPFKKGNNLRIELSVNLTDTFNDIPKKIKLKTKCKCSSCNGEGGSNPNICFSCNGSGKTIVYQNSLLGRIMTERVCTGCNGDGSIVTNKCKVCTGLGTTDNNEEIDIVIPKGVRNGDNFTAQGKGNFSRGATVAGDLLIVIRVINDTKFSIDEVTNNLKCDITINYIDAIFGTETYIELPDKKMTSVKINPGFQGGIIQISNAGLPKTNDPYNTKTHLLVNIIVKIPNINSMGELSPEKALLNQIKSLK